MQYEIRYVGSVVGSYFGRLLQPGQSFLTSASHAFELHNDGSGKWHCPEIEKAKAELANPPVDVAIELGAGISIDEIPQHVHDKPGTTQESLLPPLVSTQATAVPTQGVTVEHKCPHCNEAFTSKKKLSAHVAATHAG